MQQSTIRSGVIFCTIWGLTACGSNPVKSTQPLDLSKASALEIIIEADNPNLQTDAIKMQTGKNLAGWDYPIAPEAGSPASHTMMVLIGTPKHGSTPSGFSFSMGNSDPRALEFQKAEVLPITCSLSIVKQPEPNAELNMGFSDSAVTGANPDVNALADHASTVCFNLLTEINWPVKTKSEGNKSEKKIWMPEIRIEQEEPVSSTESKPETDTPSAPSTSPAPKTQAVEEPKPVTKEINKEGRKVYIIHNQGNPITFKFGHDRK